MRKGIFILSMFSMVGLFSGCASSGSQDPIYPSDPNAQKVSTLSQFASIESNPNEFMNKEMKLAGRIQRIEPTDVGYLVLAKWLPYPKTLAYEKGPRDPDGVDSGRHFMISFRGKREKTFVMTEGNKFIMEGTIAGTRKTVVGVFGRRKALLHVKAKCVHVWETGSASLSNQPDTQYPEARRRTLCADK